MHYGCPIFDLKFHPQYEVLGVAAIDGRVGLHSYDPRDGIEHTAQMTLQAGSPCRCIDFSESNYIAMGTKAGVVKVTELLSGVDRFAISDDDDTEDGPDGISQVRWLTSDVLATGSDEGIIKLWDKRKNNPLIGTIKECEDVINALDYVSIDHALWVLSGDKLAKFDLRKPGSKLEAMSDEHEYDLRCMAICDGHSKIVCGTDLGPLNIYHYDDIGYYKEKIPVDFEGSTNAIVKLESKLLLVGNEAGRVDVYSVNPNAFCGVLYTQKRTWGPDERPDMVEDLADDASTDSSSNSEPLPELPEGASPVDILTLDKDRSVVASAANIYGEIHLHPVAEAFKMYEARLSEEQVIDISATTTGFFNDL